MKETIQKAYGNVPKEVMPVFDFDISPFRSVKYYWLLLVRKFTR
jgi:hypothetical protein